MYILIAGTRKVYKEKEVENVIEEFLQKYSNIIVLHGNATGVDKIADRVAKSKGYKVQKFPANWAKYGKAAGPIRNKEMVDILQKDDILLAFPLSPPEDSKGTYNTIGLAKKKGISVYIHELT